MKVRSEDGFVLRTLKETHVTASSTSADLFRSLVVIECGPKNPNSIGHALELSGPATRLFTVCWTKSEGMDQPQDEGGSEKTSMHPSLPPAAMYHLHPFLQLAVSVDFLHLHLCAHALETRRPGSYLQAASGAPAASFPHSGPPWP